MIEKMQFINITGPKNDIDRMVNVYLSKYEIHLESSFTELKNVKALRPFLEINPYKDVLTIATNMVKKIKEEPSYVPNTLTVEEASSIIYLRNIELEEFNQATHGLKEDRNHMRELIQQIEPFRLLDYDLRKILHFRFIKYRFGRISHEYFDKFSQYIYDNLNTVFYDCYSDKDYVWGVYFAPDFSANEVDAIYSSLHFERIFLPDEYEGTPEEAYQTIRSTLDQTISKLNEIYTRMDEFIHSHASELMLAYQTLATYSHNFNVRKMASLTEEKTEGAVFYILCGWMSTTDVTLFLSDIKDDTKVFVITNNTQEDDFSIKPPTKLKNASILKPFELFVHMYGLPAYHEIDPTLFVALTYSFLFGAMFGDVGQGLCLVIGGGLLYHFKKMNIAGIISIAGIFSTFFGFAYGSIFGFEDVFHGFWLEPMHNVMTVLIVSVGAGVCLILLSIVLNIINSIRTKEMEKLWFDPNGIAGLIFYLALILCVLAIVLGFPIPGTFVLVLLLGLPLLAMFLKEPLMHFLEHKKQLISGPIGMYFVESIVELFEIVLSYATNTISFLRVGAFALSHAGMMQVVLILAGVESGQTNWLVIILGNLIVAGMEGLIVGIQVLRLEYYEMFGRFYRGTGKEFHSFSELN